MYIIYTSMNGLGYIFDHTSLLYVDCDCVKLEYSISL